MASKCYVRIKGNAIVSVLDSGAAVSIMTNDMRKRLGLKITKPSDTVIIIADGS
jgi:predicted aspartyl protease